MCQAYSLFIKSETFQMFNISANLRNTEKEDLIFNFIKTLSLCHLSIIGNQRRFSCRVLNFHVYWDTRSQVCPMKQYILKLKIVILLICFIRRKMIKTKQNLGYLNLSNSVLKRRHVTFYFSIKVYV